MPRTVAVVGTDAVAEAMRQIHPDVVAAYPITPQTAIVETFSQMVANGDVHTEMINVESEHSAMSACIGAAGAGARVMTATSSQGLALMWELLYIASGLRLPIVMPNVNRSLSAPINIHCDHGDSMGARDSGWIQIHSENVQESYDNTLQAVRIAEHKDVVLPTMVNLDGFLVSHSMERVDFYDDDKVRKFIGPYDAPYTLLDPDNPITVGAFDTLGGFYYELKRAQEEGMTNALRVVEEVGKEFKELSGRDYGLFEEYAMEDAEVVLVAMGSTAGTIKTMVSRLRAQGMRIGFLKVRLFRPFPAEALVKALAHIPVIGVLDRSLLFAGGTGGPLFNELRSAFYNSEKRPVIEGMIYGLGGRDLGPEIIENLYKELLDGKFSNEIRYLGLKEGDE